MRKGLSYVSKNVYLCVKKKGNNMEIRPYTKSELAMAYAPDLSPTNHSALNRLMSWIKGNRKLLEKLQESGYRTNQHYFTSLQVRLIFEYLGEP